MLKLTSIVAGHFSEIWPSSNFTQRFDVGSTNSDIATSCMETEKEICYCFPWTNVKGRNQKGLRQLLKSEVTAFCWISWRSKVDQYEIVLRLKKSNLLSTPPIYRMMNDADFAYFLILPIVLEDLEVRNSPRPAAALGQTHFATVLNMRFRYANAFSSATYQSAKRSVGDFRPCSARL
ncbi:hypothetical protein CC78DRAFT_574019 [Lojkania enalia]|uniref:Uncharacterized protein n=1 Tax=Lojkania enalia TaxID=147567 RepID=A0A9P4TRS3_9PLEO|nr:hypothetical protein CC78DRAFT_574019 [Didymosphaeria enalia]